MRRSQRDAVWYVTKQEDGVDNKSNEVSWCVSQWSIFDLMLHANMYQDPAPAVPFRRAGYVQVVT